MKQADFTQGKILGPLIKFCVPIFIALFLQAMYGAVDLWVVGRFDTAAAVSAVSTGSLIMHGATSVLYGLTVGCTIHLGQRIGSGDREGAARTTGASVWLFAVVGVLVGAVLALLAPWLAHIMHAPEEAFAQTVTYVVICACGTIFIVGYNTTCGLLRGMGESKLPLVFVGAACVFNVGGDLLLVAVFHMGAAGAAIATIAAQALSAVLAFVVLRKRGLPFPFEKRHVKPFRAEIGHILKYGVPIALQELLTSVSFMVILSIFNSLGLIVSAGVGVAEKLCSFIMLVPAAFMSGVSTVVAHNTGARKPERAKKTLFYAIGASFVCGIAIFFFMFFRGDLAAGIFDRDPAIIAAAADYLRAYAIDCLLVCAVFCTGGYFEGLGKTTFVMIQNIAAAFLVRIPFAYFMSLREGASLFAIGLATPCASVFSIILFAAYYLVTARKKASPLDKPAHNE